MSKEVYERVADLFPNSESRVCQLKGIEQPLTLITSCHGVSSRRHRQNKAAQRLIAQPTALFTARLERSVWCLFSMSCRGT